MKRQACQDLVAWKGRVDRKPLVVRGARQVGKTLLFLDEVQASPKAIACLRYFQKQFPDLHVIHPPVPAALSGRTTGSADFGTIWINLSRRSKGRMRLLRREIPDEPHHPIIRQFDIQ